MPLARPLVFLRSRDVPVTGDLRTPPGQALNVSTAALRSLAPANKTKIQKKPITSTFYWANVRRDLTVRWHFLSSVQPR